VSDPVWITCLVAVLAVFILVIYVVHKSQLRRFRLSIEGGWKQVKLNIEVDAKDKPDELR
jgi:hypothetical protein